MHNPDFEPGATRAARPGTTLTGAVLAFGAAAALAAVLQHPTASRHDAAGLVADIRQFAAADRWVHGALAAISTLTTTGMFVFATRLGLRRPHVLAGAVASGVALTFVCLAVMLDGFVAPALADGCREAACAATTQGLLRLDALQIEYLTRFGLIATAAATGLWAADLLIRRDGARVVGTIGALAAAAQLWLLFAHGGRLNPHSLAVTAALQAVWTLGVAGLMLFRRGPYAEAASGRAG